LVQAVEKYSKDQCGVIPRDRSKLVAIVGVTFGILAVIAFSLRIISKMTHHGGAFGLDDYIMVVAVVSFPDPYGTPVAHKKCRAWSSP
jgi:hypothetical protein